MKTYVYCDEGRGPIIIGGCIDRQDAKNHLRKEMTQGEWVPGEHHFLPEHLFVVDAVPQTVITDALNYIRSKYKK